MVRRIELPYRLRRTNTCSRKRSLQRFLYPAASAALRDLKNQCRSTRRNKALQRRSFPNIPLICGAALRCGLSRRIIATGLPKRPSPSESRLRESPGIRSAMSFTAIPAMCGQSAFSDAAHFESSTLSRRQPRRTARLLSNEPARSTGQSSKGLKGKRLRSTPS